MEELRREQLEKMVDVLTSVVLEFADAQMAEMLLRENGFETEELEAVGLGMEV